MKYMTAVLFILLMGTSYADKVIVMDVTVYKEGSAEINDIKVRYGSPEIKNPEGTHSMVVSGGRTVSSKNMTITFKAYYHEEIFYYNSSMVYSRLPYDPDSKMLDIYEGEEIIHSENIGKLLCNHDEICGGYENYLSCGDCGDKSKDGFCDRVLDGVCDGDCGDDPDCLLVNYSAHWLQSTLHCKIHSHLPFLLVPKGTHIQNHR